MKVIGVPLIERRKPFCAIFDLDGTTCNTIHRQHLWDAKKHHQFFLACKDDTIYPEIGSIIGQYYYHSDDTAVILSTGRGVEYSSPTCDWLADHHVPFHHLLMRDKGDNRRDAQVKLEMLDYIRASGYTVRFSIDDRPEVVAMWRGNGVPCLQVDPVTWSDQNPDTGHSGIDEIAWLKRMSEIPGADPMYGKALHRLLIAETIAQKRGAADMRDVFREGDNTHSRRGS